MSAKEGDRFLIVHVGTTENDADWLFVESASDAPHRGWIKKGCFKVGEWEQSTAMVPSFAPVAGVGSGGVLTSIIAVNITLKSSAAHCTCCDRYKAADR